MWIIADHPTPKISEGVAYTMESRDYKGVMIIVVPEQDGSIDGEQSSGELFRAGRIRRHVGDE